MSARFLRILAVAVLMATALFLPLRPAQAAPGGPAEATAPPEGWVEIQPGEYHWYMFNYKWDEKQDKCGEDEHGHAILGGMRDLEVKFYTQPAEGATLTVRNGQQAALWERDGKHEHFGAAVTREWIKGHDDEKEMEANKNKDEKDHVHTAPDAKEHAAYATWSGHMTESGTYYLVVEHARNVAGPVSYRIEMKGDGLSLPCAAAAVAAPAPAPAAVAAPAPAAVAAAGDVALGPDFATAPPGDWTEIDAGEYLWYAFRYDGAKKDAQPISVKLWTEPRGAAGLTVRTAAQAALWERDGKHESMGACTCQELPVIYADEDEEEDKAAKDDDDKDSKPAEKDKTVKSEFGSWTGKPAERGVYYIVVEHARNVSGPVMFRIELQGDGVTPGL